MVKHVTQWLCVVEILVLLLWKIRKPQGTESPQQDQQVRVEEPLLDDSQILKVHLGMSGL